MTLDERMKAAKPYLKLFNISTEDGAVMTALKFPEKWTIPDDEDMQKEYKVYVNEGEEEGSYIFITEIENGYDRMFDAIDEIINTNVEAEKIKELLIKKINELKTIFLENSYDRLQTLEFTFPDGNETTIPAKKKKKVAKKIEEPVAVEEAEEPVNDEPAQEDTNVQEPNSLLEFAEALSKESNK